MNDPALCRSSHERLADHHRSESPPRHHNRNNVEGDPSSRGVFGVFAFTSRLHAVHWPPNFKVSNVDKYEPKQTRVASWLSTP
jgi:hypothetical protein